MNLTREKMAAALSAVSLYIQTEEEALVMTPIKKSNFRRFDQGNLWGISGRQDLMQMRNMMYMKAFSC